MLITVLEDSGRGLAATKDVEANQPLFTIPKSCLLNADTLHKWAKKHSVTHLSSVQLLTCYLALYKAQGEELDASPYTPYLQSLPFDFDFHPLSWLVNNNQRMVEKLAEETKYKLIKVQDRFKQDKQAVSNQFPALSTGDILWAWLNVNTRSLYYGCKRSRSHQDNITMCPLLDFANHSLGATNFNTSEFRRAGHPIPTMIAPKNGLRSEEQVYLLYGFHSNQTLFVEYGFTASISPPELSIDSRVVTRFGKTEGGAEKRALLEARGYWGDWTLHADPTPAHPSYRLIPALRLLHVSLQDQSALQRWEATVNGELDEISPQNSERMRNTLKELCLELQEEAAAHLSPLDALIEEGFSMASIQQLWLEQHDICTAIVQNISDGIEL
ncbi:hypothetical protein FRC14_003260 [Serendipita sp. 396]|nr:hypothetical protein FRC14_003260 [Serendipita sp. 396]KAG8799592.1 hypothetical protein FRC16_004762 [Serendipita sp. 398]